MNKDGKKSVVSVNYAGELPLKTRSLCPECMRTLDAVIYDKNGKVYIKRTCPEHGEWDEIYWESTEYYNRFRKSAAKAHGLENPNVGKFVGSNGTNCPMDCGLCSNHHNHTALSNIALTNRCDLSCWYCFFYAKEGDPIYEPERKVIKNMLINLRKESPVPNNAIQFTGGEPTLREDVVEIIKDAKEVGFDHIQLNTHAINLGRDPKLAHDLKEAGVSTLYMSFDGTTPKTNPKNHYEVPRALDVCRKENMGIVLVPTVIRSVNEQNLGSIINFGLNHSDVVRGVNFQPVSLVGRMPAKLRNQQRITIPGAIELIEEQTNGIITKDDFFSVPCVAPVTDFIQTLAGARQYELNIHFACGAATYVFKDDNGKIIPLPQFVDVEGFFEYLKEKTEDLGKGNKILNSAKVLLKLNSFIDKKKQPKNLNLASILTNALVKHNYSALGQLHHNSLFVGMMHFMDPYLYDQMRVERCDIHYAMPDGRIIPFCAFNVIPELYRDKVQSQYSYTPEQFKEKYPHIDVNYKYKRNINELVSEPRYKESYVEIENYFNNPIIDEEKKSALDLVNKELNK